MMIRLACLLSLFALPAPAHQLTVFASADCEAVTVEAKFTGGRGAATGEVRVRDGDNTLLRTQTLGDDGTLRLPLAEMDHAKGLLIEVDTGGHDNYWILTPEDIARGCEENA